NSARLPVSKEQAIATYVHHLNEATGKAYAKRSGRRMPGAVGKAYAGAVGGKATTDWWEPQLALALLGGFLLLGWPKIVGALTGDPAVRKREKAELEWWSERIREASPYLP